MAASSTASIASPRRGPRHLRCQRLRRPRRLPGDAAAPAFLLRRSNRQRLERSRVALDERRPDFFYRTAYTPGYAASKTAENAITLAMMIELEQTDIKINPISSGFTSTALNDCAGTESVEDGSREVVRIALLGPDGPTNTFTRWEDTTIPW